ncbi:antitoxin VbhA family protein [Bacillus sp. USDA818B3_A]|uniref:antitoxin VbhA family protein n=1 Tax=Bacillus sp. USDA818B3_A TaxID=2698834 RepID=UPI00136E2240|nr:antitoxin VbhA family protein [Bacillus sp. USDA818B3_A]
MEKDKIKKALANAKASVELEGLKVKPECMELVEKRLRNQITEEEFQEKVKQLVHKK